MSAMKIDISKGRPQTTVSAAEMAALLGVEPVIFVPGGIQIVPLPIEQLHSFSRHTYKVVNNEEMCELTQSIRENGIITPIYVRPNDSGYEIISGHRRVYAAKLVGLNEVPAIVETLDDSTAAIRMVETNRYRETVLPSERAMSYKLAADELNRQGRRSDLYGTGEGQQSLTEITGEKSDRNIRNWIRLNYLIAPLLALVDEGELLPVRAGVELSFMNHDAQLIVCNYLTQAYKKLSVQQSMAVRNCCANEDLTPDRLRYLLNGEEKPLRPPTISLKRLELARISGCIPEKHRESDAAEYIIQALEYYQNHA